MAGESGVPFFSLNGLEFVEMFVGLGAAPGYTIQVLTEDRLPMRKTELENRIAVLMGGRAAEAFVFGDVSTGARNDLSRATDIARSKFKKFGMSPRLSQVYSAHERQAPMFGPPQGADGNYSDEPAKIIDEEVRRIVDDQYAVAFGILEAHRPLLLPASHQKRAAADQGCI